MKAFAYYNAKDLAEASAVLGDPDKKSKPLAGGTDLVGELKNLYLAPDRLVNLKSIKGLDRIQFKNSEGLSLGALVTLTEIAGNKRIRSLYLALAEAAESVGTPQLRNVGTLGGNLCQRPRCWYYRSLETQCLRKGGDQCFAVSGRNKYHCILDGGPCFIVHPSDTAPVLMAFGASVTVASAKGSRQVPLDKFFVLPAVDSTRENILKPGEIVSQISLPAPTDQQKSCYLKFRERESRDFALVGAAVVLEMDGGTCRKASIVLSGVSPAPHKSVAAENMLQGKKIDQPLAVKVAQAALANAVPLEENEYKVQLAMTVLKRAVLRAAGVSVQL